MDRKEQGKLLRAWRHYVGKRGGAKITLMALATRVAELAEERGISPSSRRVPGSHASMTRWELGDVDQSLVGLDLIAHVYGVHAVDLMRAPPSDDQGRPTEADDEMVSAFREFLASRSRD